MEICNTWWIDGYTRVIVYLKCAGNNRANTVVSMYTDAVNFHGLPNKVRSDSEEGGRDHVIPTIP